MPQLISPYTKEETVLYNKSRNLDPLNLEALIVNMMIQEERINLLVESVDGLIAILKGMKPEVTVNFPTK